MTPMIVLQIPFLDGHPPIDVELRPTVHYEPQYGCGAMDLTDLHVGYGDREDDLQGGSWEPREIRMMPPKVYPDHRATVTPEEIARVQAIVNHLWTETPTVATACEKYRQIAQSIHNEFLPKPRPEPVRKARKYHMVNGKRAYLVPGDGWEAVTDVPCPVCPSGMVRWDEAGNAPGYRRCDHCKRRFIALVQAGLAKAPNPTTSYLTVQA